jgi:hypothetical protein
MPAKKTWRLARVPENAQMQLQQRLQLHAAKEWRDQCDGVEVKVRGVYAYVDAVPKGEETATHLCRLEYLGRQDEWGFAFYKYSDQKYERSVLLTGSFVGTPEECFDCSAMAYLQ